MNVEKIRHTCHIYWDIYWNIIDLISIYDNLDRENPNIERQSLGVTESHLNELKTIQDHIYSKLTQETPNLLSLILFPDRLHYFGKVIVSIVKTIVSIIAAIILYRDNDLLKNHREVFISIDEKVAKLKVTCDNILYKMVITNKTKFHKGSADIFRKILELDSLANTNEVDLRTRERYLEKKILNLFIYQFSYNILMYKSGHMTLDELKSSLNDEHIRNFSGKNFIYDLSDVAFNFKILLNANFHLPYALKLSVDDIKSIEEFVSKSSETLKPSNIQIETFRVSFKTEIRSLIEEFYKEIDCDEDIPQETEQLRKIANQMIQQYQSELTKRPILRLIEQTLQSYQDTLENINQHPHLFIQNDIIAITSNSSTNTVMNDSVMNPNNLTVDSILHMSNHVDTMSNHAGINNLLQEFYKTYHVTPTRGFDSVIHEAQTVITNRFKNNQNNPILKKIKDLLETKYGVLAFKFDNSLCDPENLTIGSSDNTDYSDHIYDLNATTYNSDGTHQVKVVSLFNQDKIEQCVKADMINPTKITDHNPFSLFIVPSAPAVPIISNPQSLWQTYYHENQDRYIQDEEGSISNKY